MNDRREQRIRERAHQIWEREGQPHGQEQSHWERASREIDEEDLQTTTVKGENADRDRSSQGTGTERASGEPSVKSASSSRTSMADPQKGTGGSSEGQSKA